jgi:imidazolonepropionase-like amidohydrolase
VINLYNSGSLNDVRIAEQTFTDEEFAAIIETAHGLGRIVIADGHTAAGINAALRAGADIVDTAPWPDEDSWKLMRETGAAFEPHLYAFQQVVGNSAEDLDTGTMHWIPSPIMQRLFDIKNKPFSAERAYSEGIPIVFGSDTGVIPHGSNAGEFAELVKIGMTAAEAIEAATAEAARVLRLDHLIGTLEPGKTADLIATSASPLEDIRELERVRFVMKGGVVFRNELSTRH